MAVTDGQHAPSSSPASPERVAGRAGLSAWLALAILLLFGLIGFLDRQVLSLMVDLVKHDLRLSDTQIGILQGPAFGLAFPLFAVPLGYAADRYSRRWVIFFGVAFWSLAASAGGLANSFYALLAARVAVAVGEAALGPATASLLADLFPRRRLGVVFSIYAVGAIIGAAIALAVGGWVVKLAGHGVVVPLLGHLAAWQVTLIATGLPGAALAWLALVIREPPRTRSVAEPGPPWSEVFAFIGRNWLYLVCNILGFSSMLVVTWGALAWTPVALSRSYGWSVAKIGAVLGLYTAVLGVLGQMTNGAVVDRIFGRGVDDAHLRYYAIAAVAITLSAVCAPFAATGLLYLLILSPSKTLMQYGGVSSASLQVVSPSAIRGRLTALCGIVSAVLGGSFGPSIVAYFTDQVFHEPSKVIFSLGITNAIFIPMAGLLFWIGMRPMRVLTRLTPEAG